MARPKRKTVTRLTCCQYLLSSQTNYTLTHYTEHIEQLSHDMVNRYLTEEKLTPQLVWEHTREQIVMDESGYIVFDDSVLDKNYSTQIESVRWQYSGNAHQLDFGQTAPLGHAPNF